MMILTIASLACRKMKRMKMMVVKVTKKRSQLLKKLAPSGIFGVIES